MRASEVREAIITAVAGSTSDSKAGAGDQLRVLRTAREPETVQDRVFMVRLMSLSKDNTNTCDAHGAVYQIAVYYAPHPDVDDRIAADSERMHDPLWALSTIAADVMECQPGDVFVEEAEGRVVARRDVAVIYRRSFT